MCAISVDGFKRNISIVILKLGQWLRYFLKIFLFLALAAILFSAAELFVHFFFHYGERLCKISFSFGPVVHEMFEDLLYPAEQIHLQNFDRGQYWEHLNYLNLDQ